MKSVTKPREVIQAELTENADKRDQDLLRRLIVGRSRDSDDGDDELRDGHARGTVEEERATTQLVDRPHAGHGGTDVDNVRRDRNDERVVDARVFEELGALIRHAKTSGPLKKAIDAEKTYVVEDKVDTGELLQRLEADSGPGAESVLARSAFEAVEVSRRAERALVVDVGRDLGEFLVDLGRIGVGAQDARERFARLFVAAFEEEPTGRFGKDRETDDEDLRSTAGWGGTESVDIPSKVVEHYVQLPR